MEMVQLSYFSRYTDEWTVAGFFSDRWVTKLSKVWGSARASSVRRSSATNTSDASEDSTLLLNRDGDRYFRNYAFLYCLYCALPKTCIRSFVN